MRCPGPHRRHGSVGDHLSHAEGPGCAVRKPIAADQTANLYSLIRASRMRARRSGRAVAGTRHGMAVETGRPLLSGLVGVMTAAVAGRDVEDASRAGSLKTNRRSRTTRRTVPPALSLWRRRLHGTDKESPGKGRSAVPGPSDFRVSGVVRLADVDTARLRLSTRTRQHTGTATGAPTSRPTCPSSWSAACARTGSCSTTPARATAARAVGSPASTGKGLTFAEPESWHTPDQAATVTTRYGTAETPARGRIHPASAKQPARVEPRRPGLRRSGRRSISSSTGAPFSTPPAASAESATSPAPPSFSTNTGNDQH